MPGFSPLQKRPWHRVEERPGPQGVAAGPQLESAPGAIGQMKATILPHSTLFRNWQKIEGTQIYRRIGRRA